MPMSAIGGEGDIERPAMSAYDPKQTLGIEKQIAPLKNFAAPAVEPQTATSEVLNVIAASPGDLELVPID